MSMQHWSAQCKLRRELEAGKVISIIKPCEAKTKCNRTYPVQNISVKPSEKVVLEFRIDEHNIADVAIVDTEGKARFVFEVFYSHHIRSRPVPWTELDADDILTSVCEYEQLRPMVCIHDVHESDLFHGVKPFEEQGLDDLQQAALEDVVDGNNVLITGPGGVGKSYLLKYIVQQSAGEGKRVFLTATTGIAAENLKARIGSFRIRGSTLDSFMGINFIPEWRERSPPMTEKKLQNIRHMDILIVDEISMFTSEKLRILDDALRHFRNSTEKFGGVQLVLVGDDRAIR
jgi:hypothetical protein